ncbi:putative c6 transcription protein [Botrytis fragariae]|uniref:Putative c6 transcription protein n=1 Tax=Botrytis fragariae TaxID=1964551 RepID=A0A8H6EE30_9HELO|nr:putative c6 transcription protein [Botrytis fragariae]KAF5868771.1 putative c6 transcription protein [Botrytis fragariae]
MSGSNFRTLLPGDMDTTMKNSSSSDSSKNKNTTPETTGSNSHATPAPLDKRSESAGPISKKRKVPTSITANACVNCKRARAKCDGKQPCTRCTSKRSLYQDECNYEPHTKNAKTMLVRDLKESHDIRHKAEIIFTWLANNTENEHDILERIKNRESITEIANWLESIESTGESQLSIYGGSNNEVDGDLPNEFAWTTVTDDDEVIEHLISLYFTWVHPFYPLFNEGHFVESMHRGSDQFCSHSLFNAICAMACYLHTIVDEDTTDYRRMGAQFSDLVRNSIDPQDNSLTNIQAFAVMFLVRCAQGQGFSGSVYLSIASRSMESLRPSNSDSIDYRQIWRETVKGLNSLNVEWAQMTFTMAPAYIPDLQPTQSAEEISLWEADMDNLSWAPYRFPTNFISGTTFPCLIATTNRKKMELVDIIHKATILLSNTTGPLISAEALWAIYRRLLTWHEDLPRNIAIGGEEVQALPHVYSLHILYATTAVYLLSPLLGFKEPQLDALIRQHAKEGLKLLVERYHFHYTSRYQPVSQMFAMLYLMEVLIQSSPETDKDSGKNAIAYTRLATDILTESNSSFPVASVFMGMLQENTRRFLIPLPNELEDLFRHSHRMSKFPLDDAINAFGSTTYVQPVEAMRKRMSPDFGSRWMMHAAAGYPKDFRRPPLLRQPSAEATGAQNLMRILNLHNHNTN